MEQLLNALLPICVFSLIIGLVNLWFLFVNYLDSIDEKRRLEKEKERNQIKNEIIEYYERSK